MQLKDLMKQAPSVVSKASSAEELKGMFRKMAENIPGTSKLWETIAKEIDRGKITTRSELVKRIEELK